MACANEYRDFAAQQRQEAEACALPLARQRHLNAARRWESLAEETERFEIRNSGHVRIDMIY